MKKRLLLLCWLSMLFVIAACSKDGAVPQQSDTANASTATSSPEQSGISEAGNNSKPTESSPPSPQRSLLEEAQGAAPDFLDAEQQALYKRAKTAYMEFAVNNGGFGSEGGENPDLEQNDMQYYKCNGTITRWEDFENAMLSVFTAEYFEELNDGASYTDGGGTFHKRTIFAEQNGDLYYSGGARGWNIDFIEPETFELESQSDDEIQFYVIGTYDDFAYDKDGNIIEKDGQYQRAGNPQQEKYHLTMIKTPNGWRFSEFQVAF